MSESEAARHYTTAAAAAASKAPPNQVPPLAQCGDEGAESWKWLLGSTPKTLANSERSF